jgi:hypothetical protein
LLEFLGHLPQLVLGRVTGGRGTVRSTPLAAFNVPSEVATLFGRNTSFLGDPIYLL